MGKNTEKWIKVRGTTVVEVELSERDLAWAIMSVVVQETGVEDDAGCDWFTNWTGGDAPKGLYIADERWFISDNEKVMRLVDAANILSVGHRLDLFGRD